MTCAPWMSLKNDPVLCDHTIVQRSPPFPLDTDGQTPDAPDDVAMVSGVAATTPVFETVRAKMFGPVVS
jgi:hypothetical protein